METQVKRSTLLAADWGERALITGVFLGLVLSRHDRLFDPSTRVWFLLYCVSEGLVVAFVLARRHTDDVTFMPADWALAVTATFLPLFVTAGGDHLVPVQVGLVLVLGGMTMQISAKLILRRSFGLIAANRGIKESGPYRLVRHPMYAGYGLTHLGLFLMSPLLLNGLLYTVAWIAQIMRILAEERLLERDPQYRSYMERVPNRLIPRVF